MVTTPPERILLGELLQRLQRLPKDHHARVKAAELALSLALSEGDPQTADIAEALLADAPSTTAHEQAILEHIAATARATRRAIALARRAGSTSPAALADFLSADARALADEVIRLAATDRGIALATLELAERRHPGHPLLLAARESI